MGTKATSGQVTTRERINRREALRRGAVVGGTLVWGAPVVQRLGSSPAFAATSPAPEPSDPGDTDFHGISYVGFVFTCDQTLWRAKWEEGKGWISVVTLGAHDSLPHCTPPAGWTGATGVPGPGYNAPVPPGTPVAVSTTMIGGDLYQVCFTVPSGCTFQAGAGVAKGAGGSNLFCASPTISADGRTACFTAPSSS